MKALREEVLKEFESLGEKIQHCMNAEFQDNDFTLEDIKNFIIRAVEHAYERGMLEGTREKDSVKINAPIKP